VKEKEQKNGQSHKVFEDSFDAKECNSNKFVYQELDYMHKNPVSKKWQLISDFTDHLYSSASYYENGINQNDKLLHVNEVLLRSIMLHSRYRIPGSALFIQSH